MNRYWIRIAIGAVVIFAFGLMGITAFNRGKAKVGQLLATVGTSIPMQLAHLPIEFDGRRLGELRNLTVQRASPSEVGTVAMTVALEDAADLADLGDCALTLDRLNDWDDGGGFRCAAPGEADRLVEIGKVTFEPGGVTRPFSISRHDADRWQRSEVRSLDASLTTDAAGGVTAGGSFELATRHHGIERGSFSLRATEAGAEVSVKDARGRSLFEFHSDGSGVRFDLKEGRALGLVKLLTDRR